MLVSNLIAGADHPKVLFPNIHGWSVASNFGGFVNKTAKYLMHPVSIGVFVVVLAIGMSFNESSKEERREVKVQDIESVKERLWQRRRVEIKVECINGVEYWLYKGTSDTLMLTPKYSRGHDRPDTCVNKVK